MTARTHQVLLEVSHERDAQDAKWGEQNHPSVLPVSAATLHKHYGIPTEEDAKATCDYRARMGTLSYADIAVEELAEAVNADGDVARRAELVQLAAVVVAWIECIDRRLAKKSGGAT